MKQIKEDLLIKTLVVEVPIEFLLTSRNIVLAMVSLPPR